MQQRRECKFFGYVKVEVRSRSPRRWAWSVCLHTDLTMVVSNNLFICAEDAWRAGSQVLTALEQGVPVEEFRMLEEAG